MDQFESCMKLTIHCFSKNLTIYKFLHSLLGVHKTPTPEVTVKHGSQVRKSCVHPAHAN